MCAVPIEREHGHVVDLRSTMLLCACRACHELFVRPGAARGRFRAVLDRYAYLPAVALSEADWDELCIPARVVFLRYDSALGRAVALCPGRDGVSESKVPPDAWDRLLAADPRLADARPDIEALLIARGRNGFEGHLIPIDECHRVAGLIGRGRPGRAIVERYLARLRRRAARTAERNYDLE